MSHFSRTAGRLGVVVVVGAALSIGGAVAASAHVSVIADKTTAGSYALLTFGVPHGCDGSATTKVAIKIPEQINAVTPTVNPNWTVEKVKVALATPITDSHGNQITERVDQVVYTAKTPLPDGYRDAFVLSTQIPDAVGETLTFPTVQTCEVGETAWVEVAAAGAEEPAHPAPAFEVTEAATGDGHSDTAAAAAMTSGEAAPTSTAEVAATATTTESGSTTSWVSIAALVAGLLGLGAGGVALARTRRT